MKWAWPAVCVIVAALALCEGVRLRWNLWEWTQPIRFVGDINNGFNHGRRASEWGYLNVYERLKPEPGRATIDYGPLRLGVMSAWVSWLKSNDYPTTDYRSDDVQKTRAYHAPLLNFNMTMELLAAVAAFLLVWHVRRRSIDPAQHAWALPLSLLAALLVWFNPASMLEAHAWPQWDVWPMPFFLFALYCGLRRWWLAAGLLIGFGSMFKGQILMVGWTIPLWAFCMGDWRGALRTIVGVFAAIMLVGSPWALSNYDEATKLRIIHPAAIGITVLATLAAILVPRRFSPALVCFAIATSLYVSMSWLGGTDYWYRSALDVGTWHFHTMRMGPTSNLPAILETQWQWQIDDLLFTLPAFAYRDSAGAEGLRIGGDITMRTLLLSIYFGLSALCAVRAAFLDRGRDTRVLLALSIPWLLFFVIPCQVHERYLVFVSMCAATWVACGAGVTLIGVVLTVVAFMHVIVCMIGSNGIDWVGMEGMYDSPFGFIRRLIDPTNPGIAWLLLLAVLILLYNIFTPVRRPPACCGNGVN